jgi:hypothetical protein
MLLHRELGVTMQVTIGVMQRLLFDGGESGVEHRVILPRNSG